jgi:DNA polymerase I
MHTEREAPFLDPDPSAFIHLADGGFVADTEVMTVTGPTTVSELSSADSVLALNPTTGILKLKSIVRVEPVTDVDRTIAIETQRSDLRVAPDHRLVYTTKSGSTPRFARARDLDERYDYRFLNDWRFRSGTHLDEVDVTEFVDEYEVCAVTADHGHTFRAALPDGCEPSRRTSHTGYYFDSETFKQFQADIEASADETTIHAGPKCWRRPYRFDGDDFIEFLGWFISEGSVYWQSTSDSAEVKLAQKTDKHRSAIAALFERMGIRVNENNSGFSFSSTLYGELFEALCGSQSKKKRIPQFIWNCSLDQKRLLLETLLTGDGNKRRTYYTASDELAGDVLRLMLELGMKPRYTRRDSCWQIYMRTTNDGFQSSEHVFSTRTDCPLYRLTIRDFSLVMAGRNGKFQWVSVSEVA